MKFGKNLAKRHLDLPEYAQYFLDYKMLKKLMKRLAAQPADANTPEARHQRLQQNKATFFFQLERELEKVTTFYTQKESELETRLDLLEQKNMAAMGRFGELNKSSVAFVAVNEGLQRFRRDLDRLEQFVELNATGFAKVLKKWDKQSRSHTKELYLSKAVEVEPMFHRDVLVGLSDRSNACLLELEAMAQGYAGPTNYYRGLATQQTDAADDMFHEFVSFAARYAGDESALQPWLEELNAGDMSQAFLRALPTTATDDAVLAMYRAGVDVNAHDVVSNRTALHLCSSAPLGVQLDTVETCVTPLATPRSTSMSPPNSAVGKVEMDRIIETEISSVLATSRVGIFDLLLQDGAEVDALDASNRTPLIAAAIHRRCDLLRRLLQAGADPNARDNNNLTALHYAIFHNFVDCMESLLDAGAQTGNLDSERQYVPLNFACQHGGERVVSLLLRKRGQDAMVADAEGLYPLHIVARAGRASIIPILVAAGANINELDKLNGWTPLMYAAAEGHSHATRALLTGGADHNILDEKGRSALFYAAWEGHTSCFKLLSAVLHRSKDISRIDSLAASSAPPSAASSETSSQAVETATSATDATMPMYATSNSPGTTALEDLDLGDLGGEIPDLELPPPIMPLKRYGHTFLDAQTIIVQIRDVQVHLDDRRGLSAGRLTLMSSSTRDSIPRNLVLPVRPQDHVQTFEVSDLTHFSVAFDVMPAFGTRPLAKTVAAQYVFGGDAEHGLGEQGRHLRQVQLPLLDLMLRPVGMLEFTYLVVKPFPGEPLEISKYDTYWKSTAQQETAVTTLSYVTASSLHGEYRKVVVTLTRDLVPVLADLVFTLNGVEVATPLFTLEELRKLRSDTLTLREWIADNGDRLNIHVPFPSVAESRDVPVRWPAMNTYVDKIIDVVFEHARAASKQKKQRGLVFSSTHPEICAMFNWKQPNFPVLFSATAMRADGMYTSANRVVNSEHSFGELAVCKSLREASIYAATNHLMGIIAPADILSVVPAVVLAVRTTGLVLVAGGGFVEGADGVQIGGKLEFPRDIGM